MGDIDNNNWWAGIGIVNESPPSENDAGLFYDIKWTSQMILQEENKRYYKNTHARK